MVASETVLNAFYAVLAAALGIFIYVWWAFRNVPSPFRYGAAAIVALIHDAVIVIGVFAILGVLADIEVGTMFLIAILTVIGYSVNDTIVVFDRIRENVITYPNRELAEVVNLSISETIGRSLNTSLTLLITLMALFLFGRLDHPRVPARAADRSRRGHVQLHRDSQPGADLMGVRRHRQTIQAQQG